MLMVSTVGDLSFLLNHSNMYDGEVVADFSFIGLPFFTVVYEQIIHYYEPIEVYYIQRDHTLLNKLTTTYLIVRQLLPGSVREMLFGLGKADDL